MGGHKWKIVGCSNANPSVREFDGANSIIVKWDNINGDGTIKVTTGVPSQTNIGCPDCPTLTATKTIPIRYLGTPGNIKINGVAYTGSYNLGCNTTPITISVDPVDNATNYSWSLPSGWSGATNSNSITVTPNLNTQGVVKVTTSRSDVSDLVTASQLTINRPLPSISSVTPSTAPLVCSSLDVVSASASGVNADQYVWTPTGGARVNGFSAAQTVAGSVNLGATSNGSFTIQAYSSACNVASSNTKTLNIRYGPPVLGSQIFSPPYLCQSYEAPFSVNLVADVTSYDWTVSGSGAILVSGQGSSAVMAKSIYVSPFTVSVVGTNTCGISFPVSKTVETRYCENDWLIATYPNPATDYLTIQFKNEKQAELFPDDIKIYNENGLAIDNTKTINFSSTLNERSFQDGNKIKLNVKDLPRGTHYFHFMKNGAVLDKVRVLLK
ncbi:T9SS type A sorting domain-containing protein [Dyadobacter sp. 32]|uniref:T9SS type A sorting domain-containing protein n=1 Tax=Dyadobacter sp. 32 TaxID=538966 RepID=UPI0011EC44B4